jgi:hypothetical protein
MKKVTIILTALIVAGGLSFTSCKKCSTCKYVYDVAGVSFTYDYPETCGNKKDIDAYEKACSDAANLVGGSCTCD